MVNSSTISKEFLDRKLDETIQAGNEMLEYYRLSLIAASKYEQQLLEFIDFTNSVIQQGFISESEGTTQKAETRELLRKLYEEQEALEEKIRSTCDQ